MPVTALEREDIEALSNAFYRIPKTLEKFAERYILAASELRDIDFFKHVTLLEQATDITLQMLKELRQGFMMGLLGMPVSTTHSITTAIMGVGCARGFRSLDWVIAERILWAWVMTIPAAGAIAYSLVRLMGALGMR